jgi:hypothetical protein
MFIIDGPWELESGKSIDQAADGKTATTGPMVSSTSLRKQELMNNPAKLDVRL